MPSLGAVVYIDMGLNMSHAADNVVPIGDSALCARARSIV
jgi:hypothetical protein